MNDNRVFENKKEELLRLLELEMPTLVIQKMLDVSQDTVYNYLDRLRESGDWKKVITAIDEARPQMLKFYASINYTSSRIYDNRFKLILAKVLEEKKILEMLSYALPAILSFSQVKFTDDVPAGYRRLIEQLVPIYQDSSCIESTVWKEYLQKINNSEIQLPESKKFFWRHDHFVHDIIQSYAQEVRGHVAPILTARTCKIINEALENVSRQEKDVIDSYFGLYTEEQTLETIGEKLGLSRERIRQIKKKLIRKLKTILKHDLKSVSNAWEETQVLKESHQRGIHEMQENLYHENEHLLLRICEIDFSVRVCNCLGGNINYVWQLVQYNSEDLLKYRNFGRKSLREIEELLAEKNLSLEMEFEESQIAYFKIRSK